MAKELQIGVVVICALGVAVIFFDYQASTWAMLDLLSGYLKLISASIELVEDGGKIMVGIKKK